LLGNVLFSSDYETNLLDEDSHIMDSLNLKSIRVFSQGDGLAAILPSSSFSLSKIRFGM